MPWPRRTKHRRSQQYATVRAKTPDVTRSITPGMNRMYSGCARSGSPGGRSRVPRAAAWMPDARAVAAVEVVVVVVGI